MRLITALLGHARFSADPTVTKTLIIIQANKYLFWLMERFLFQLN